MKKDKFWIGYMAFVVVLLMLCVLAVGYVKNVLLDYEAAQPEKVAEQQIELIKEAASRDALSEIITFYEVEQAVYDIDISDFREYKDKIKNAGELTYKMKTGYSETEQRFNILADGEVVAVLTLESVKEEVKLAILTVNEWTVKSVTPVMTLANYDYTVEVPKGFKVFINGTELAGAQEAQNSGWEFYDVENLYSEPEIKIYDANGTEAHYDIVDNHVTPIVHNYVLRLPKGYQVSDNGVMLEGTLEGEEVVYSVMTISEELTLTDAFGNSALYKGGDNIYTYDYTVTLPDNFKISVNGKDALNYITGTQDNSTYRYCEEYATMPKLVTYEFTKAISEPVVEISDNLGQKVECIFENYTFVQTAQAGLDTIPEDVAAKVDVLEIAKMWSKLMTDDLKGTNHGFGTMKQHLITGSYLYNVAYQYVTNVDITFVATHVLENPPFSGERITNYVSYGENIFSCDIYFLKHMDLYTRDLKTTDEMNSTFYFMYYDETNDGKDNPHWVILDIQEILSE